MSVPPSPEPRNGPVAPDSGEGRPVTPVDMARAYDAYFASGLYESRYPRPNRRTMRVLRRLLPPGGRLLDYGAGEGRYCLSLARDRSADVVAVDISEVARDHLRAIAAGLGLADRIEVCDEDDDDYRRLVTPASAFDVVLFGFGVLGHVPGRRRRIERLAALRATLAPSGRLVLGLPNALRRFRAAQAEAAPRIARGELEPGDIRYARHSGQGDIELYYHMFGRAEIIADLGEAGFEVERLTAESLLPESAVTHSPLLGIADDLLSSLVPAWLGYGYLVVARPRR